MSENEYVDQRPDNRGFPETSVMRAPRLLILIAGLCAGCGEASAPPADSSARPAGEAELKEFLAAMTPYVEQGRKTYPEAKARYLAGLPDDHHFYVVTNLRDDSGNTEQVFVAVDRIEGDRVVGRITGAIKVVKGFKNDDPYTFPESELVDWVITRPDSSEEGNVVGKFMDEWQKTRTPK